MAERTRKSRRPRPSRTARPTPPTPRPEPLDADFEELERRACDGHADPGDVVRLTAEVRRLRANAAHAKTNLYKVACPHPFSPPVRQVVFVTGPVQAPRVFTVGWHLFETAVAALIDGTFIDDTTESRP